MGKLFETVKYTYKLKKYGIWYEVFERFIVSFYWFNRERISWITAPKLKNVELTIYFDSQQELDIAKPYYDYIFKEVNQLLERFYENVKDIKKLDIWFDDDEQEEEDDIELIE